MKKLNPYKAMKLNKLVYEENNDFNSEGRWKEIYHQMLLDYPEFTEYDHLTDYEKMALKKCYDRFKEIGKYLGNYIKDVQEAIREYRKIK